MDAFYTDLVAIAPAVGGGCHAFVAPDGTCRGWVQIIFGKDRRIDIHRLWTLAPGQGNGSAMLRSICELADRHGVEISLKALPFGRKPFRLSADQLVQWYARHGFVGTRKRLIRKPRANLTPKPVV